MQPPAPLPPPSSSLDTLRATAVSLVVASHLLPHLGVESGLYHLQALGVLGVFIFFVHTSLVLMLSLQRQSAEAGRWGLAADFLLRRALRIYPLSLATLLVTATFGLSTTVATPAVLLSNILLVQNLVPHPSLPEALWSLPYEMQMYLVLPALFLCARACPRLSVWLGLWLAGCAAVLALHALGLNYHPFIFIPCFLAGVLAYATGFGNGRLPPRWIAIYVSVAIMALPLLVGAGLPENLLAWPFCLGLGLLLHLCRDAHPLPFQRLISRITTYSYGIYLVHGPCLMLAFGLPLGMVGSTLVFTVLTAAAAITGYHLVEAPFIAYGRRLTRHKNYRN